MTKKASKKPRPKTPIARLRARLVVSERDRQASLNYQAAYSAEAATARAERDQARKELVAALAELDGERAKAERFEAAYHLNHQRADELEAAAAANKRRALLLCAARASCKRLRRERNEERAIKRGIRAVLTSIRGELATAQANHQAAEDRYQRAEDQRAAAESALETLEGQATLAEESVQAATNELAEGRAALRFARTVHARQRRWIIWGKLRRERDRRAVRRLRKECDQARAELAGVDRLIAGLRGSLTCAREQLATDRAAPAAAPPPPPPASSPGEDLSLPPGYRWAEERGPRGKRWIVYERASFMVGRVEQFVRQPLRVRWSWARLGLDFEEDRSASGTSDTEMGARAALARRLRASFVTETPDHCSNEHAFPGAFRALSTRTCSGAGDQPCTGEQSSPEPAGASLCDLFRGWAAEVAEGEWQVGPGYHCSPAQPARPIRAGREGRGAGRFPRGGGRPGMAEVTPRAETRKVGEMTLVAKAGPSPADRESAVNQGERARLVNPECTAGALTAEPEPEAGGSSGWFGTTGAGERVDPGGALRVAVAVLGAVDLLWWLAVRLLYLCGRRADEEPGRPGARYLGIGWHQVDGVKGGALCEAWIGYVPPTAEPRDGWPVGWEWQACPLEPPGWHLNPELDDRAFQEPGAIGVLVFGKSGRAELGACVTAWGDRWTAPGFDAARLVRLLRAEITDAELRAEERDDTEDYSDDEDDPDALADQEDARIAAIAVLVAYADEIRQRGRVGLEGAPPHGLSDCMHRALAGLTPREREILRQRCPGIPPLFADQRPEDLPDAHEESAPEPVADERPPATCRTGQEPADSRVADLPVLREGYRWEALTDSSAQVMTSAEIGRGSCVAELYPINSIEGVAGWFWSVAAWSGHDGESDVSPTRQEAAGNVARVLRRATTGEG